MEFFLLYFFSTIIIFCGIAVIFVDNPVNSVFYLILTFCNAIGILLLCEVDFLAFLLLIVYVGAIAVLFLFVIIILNLKKNFYESNSFKMSIFYKYIPIGLALNILLFGEILFFLNNNLSLTYVKTKFFIHLEYIEWVLLIDPIQNIELFGQTLYNHFFVFLIVAGFILLVALISAIALTSSRQLNNEEKKQFVCQQLSRSTASAVFLVKRKKI